MLKEKTTKSTINLGIITKVLSAVIGIGAAFIVVGQLFGALSVDGPDPQASYSWYIGAPLALLALISMILCLIAYVKRLKLSDVIRLVLCVIGLGLLIVGFFIMHNRGMPVRKVDQTLTSLTVPALFGQRADKEYSFLSPGPDDYSVSWDAIPLTGYQLCQELPSVIAGWEHNPAYDKRPTGTEQALDSNGCDLSALVNGYSIDANVGVNIHNVSSPGNACHSIACSELTVTVTSPLPYTPD
jgi:hypothetical protein